MSAAAAAPADSLRQALPRLQGRERLEAYVDLCNLYAGMNNPDCTDELAAIRDYMDEARRLRDTRHEGNARSLQVFAYYNYGLSDSLYACLPAHLEFMKKHRLWELYYACRNVRVERLLYDGKLQTAFHEAQLMYDEARQGDGRYGLGISACQMASCLYSMRRYDEAYVYFSEAEEQLTAEQAVGPLLNLYVYFWQDAMTLKRYADQLAITDRWQALLDDYCRRHGLTPDDLPVYYCYCHVSRACALMEQGDLAAARAALDEGQRYAQGEQSMLHLLVLRAESRYAELSGDYERALRLTDERHRLQHALGNRLSALETQEVRARLLHKLGREGEAATLYRAIIARKDSVYDMNTVAQLNELSTIYQVDRLRADRKRLRLQWTVAAIGCGALVLLLALYVRYNRRLQRKNRALYQRIREQQHMQEQVDQAVRSLPAEEVSRPMQLFLKLDRLMRDEQLYLRPEVNRQDIAARLGTNLNYLAEAVRVGDGKGLREYILHLRLDHAVHLLTTDRSLSVDAVALEAGFNSRATFFRAFRERFGMTPGEYRNASGQE